MGALILLLLVTTRRMHKDQQQAAGLAQHNWEEFQDPLSTDSPPPSAFVIALDESRETPPADEVTEFSISLLPPNAEKAKPSVSSDPFLDAAAVADKQAELEQLQAQLESEQQRQQSLADQIAEARGQLEQSANDTADYQLQMEQLADLTRQEAELGQRVQEKQIALAQLRLQLDRSSEATARADEMLRTQESALVSLLKIAKDAEERGDSGTASTVVEFSGASGTRRSPIVVNVTGDGFEFLPSGVRIDAYSPEHYTQRLDPLVHVAMAIHKHRSSDGTGKVPYVLLLLRPDGTPLFNRAKYSLDRAKLHYGYELLDQDHHVASGTRNAVEVRVAETAKNSSRRGRFPQYYDELVDVKKEAEQKLAEAENVDRDLDIPGFGEQYFAGGHAPRGYVSPQNRQLPETLPEPVPRDSGDTLVADGTGGFGPEPTGFDLQLPAPENATASEPSVAVPDENPFAAFEDRLDTGSTGFGTPQQTAAADSPPGDFAGSDLGSASEMPSEFLNDSLTTDIDIAGLDPRQVLPPRRSLSDNLGIGGRRAISQLPAQESANSDKQLSDTASPIRTDPLAPTRWPDSVTAIHESGSRTAGPAGDLSSSESQPSMAEGQPASDATDSNGQSTQSMFAKGDGDGGVGPGQMPKEPSFLDKFLRQVEEQHKNPAADPMLVSLMNEGRRRLNEAAVSSDEPSEPQGNVAERMTSPFENLQPTAEAPIEPNVAAQPTENPFAAMDKAAAATTESLSAPTPNITDKPPAVVDEFLTFPIDETEAPPVKKSVASQPAGSATAAPQRQSKPSNDTEAKPKETIYWVIKIYIDASELMVGDFETFDTRGWNEEQRLAMTLEAISATMDEVWAEVRKDAVPAVRFLVSPGAEEIQKELRKSLAAMNITTRGVYQQSPTLSIDKFFSDAPLPPQQSSGPTARPQRAPAEPAPVAPPIGRRSSI